MSGKSEPPPPGEAPCASTPARICAGDGAFAPCFNSTYATFAGTALRENCGVIDVSPIALTPTQSAPFAGVSPAATAAASGTSPGATFAALVRATFPGAAPSPENATSPPALDATTATKTSYPALALDTD